MTTDHPRPPSTNSSEPSTNPPSSTNPPPPSSSSSLPPHLLRLIRGEVTVEEKSGHYEASLKNWWTEYADRKNDEKDEYIANTLLYDRNHLPRMAPPPTHEVVKREEEERRRAAAQDVEEKGGQ